MLFALGNTARALGLAEPRPNFSARCWRRSPAGIEALVNLANLLRAQGQFDAAARLAGAGPGAQSGKARNCS